MIALILTFITLGSNPPASTQITTSQVQLYSSMDACKLARDKFVAYQQGKHEADGDLVNGFCVPFKVIGANNE